MTRTFLRAFAVSLFSALLLGVLPGVAVAAQATPAVHSQSTADAATHAASQTHVPTRMDKRPKKKHHKKKANKKRGKKRHSSGMGPLTIDSPNASSYPVELNPPMAPGQENDCC